MSSHCDGRCACERADQTANQNALKCGGLRVGPVLEVLEHLLVLLGVFLCQKAEPSFELLKVYKFRDE